MSCQYTHLALVTRFLGEDDGVLLPPLLLLPPFSTLLSFFLRKKDGLSFGEREVALGDDADLSGDDDDEELLACLGLPHLDGDVEKVGRGIRLPGWLSTSILFDAFFFRGDLNLCSRSLAGDDLALHDDDDTMDEDEDFLLLGEASLMSQMSPKRKSSGNWCRRMQCERRSSGVQNLSLHRCRKHSYEALFLGGQ